MKIYYNKYLKLILTITYVSIIILGAVNAAINTKAAVPPQSLWLTAFGGINDDSATGVRAYSTDMVYVVGGTNSTVEPGDSSDGFLVRIDSSGSIVWARIIDLGPLDFISRVALDPSGHVYIAGSSIISWPPQDLSIVAAKLDSSGNVLWLVALNNTYLYQDFGYDIHVDSNYVYIAGATYDVAGNQFDILIVKLHSSNGSIVWAKTIGSPTVNESAWGIVVDGNGNMYIAGATNTTLELIKDINMLVLKLDPSGSLAWYRLLNSTIVDYLFKLDLDDAGNLYVVGEVREDIYGNDIIVIKMASSNGSITWAKRIDYWRFDEGFDIKYKNEGLYIAGAGYPVYPFKNLYDAFALKLYTNGSLAWFLRIGWTGEDQGTAIDVGNNTIYMAGFTRSQGAGGLDALATALAKGVRVYICPDGIEPATANPVGNATVRDLLYNELTHVFSISDMPVEAKNYTTGVRGWRPSQLTCSTPSPTVGGVAFLEHTGVNIMHYTLLAVTTTIIVLMVALAYKRNPLLNPH